MPRGDDRDGGARDGRERGRPDTEGLPRILYWWRVPERPGVGTDMLFFVGVWFMTLLALAVIIGVIVAATG